METPELAALAKRTRVRREASIALALSCLVLVLFLFIPLAPEKTSSLRTAAPTPRPDAFLDIPIVAQAAIVYDLATHETLYAKNADAQLPLASLIKLLTVYGAVAQLGGSAPITISAGDEQVDAPHGFASGETFALSDLARLTLTGSLNDGASAIAAAAAAREGVDSSRMLASAAASLGLRQTYALNGSGLDENLNVSGGYGSARDVAILAGALLEKAPEVALATTLPFATASSLEGKTREIKNTNPTVLYAPRLLLSKTGYTDLAGGNLALIFDAGIAHPIAVVVLDSDEKARFTDAQALVAAALAYFAGVASL